MRGSFSTVYLVIVLLFGTPWSFPAYATGLSDLPMAEAVPFLGMELIAREMKKAVCAIQIQDEQMNMTWKSLGTGFLVHGIHEATLVVTCNHVVNAVDSKRQLHVGLDTDDGYKRFPCVIALTDPSHDIAILVPRKHQDDEQVTLLSTAISSDWFDDSSSLVEGRGVIIVGYPLSLGTEEDQNHPVVRSGIIAQFAGKDQFLLDGIASPGNSGSPVFALKSKENRLVGMVSGYVNDRINLFDKDGRLNASLSYNSGLARCVTMKSIAHVIKNEKLFHAIQLREIETARTLLDTGANVNTEMIDGTTPLLSASQEGCAEIVKLLLDKGANPNAKTSSGVTSLMQASFRGYTEIVKSLLANGADVNAKEKDCFTALDAAMKGGRAEIIELLRQAGAKE